MKAPLTDGWRAHTRLDPSRERRKEENGNAVFHGDAPADVHGAGEAGARGAWQTAVLRAAGACRRPRKAVCPPRAAPAGKAVHGRRKARGEVAVPRGKHPNGSYRTTKPDTDNLQKLLKDCMTTEHFWTDDALVCSEITEKFWADMPGTWIHIEPVEG